VNPDVSALILAGGKATRFGGIDKRELVIGGRTIFARQCEVLGTLVAEIIVSSPHDIAGYRTVRDAIAGAGPLAGIAAGLAAATTPWLLVVAGDMPFLSKPLIEMMLDATRDDIDAVGVRVAGMPEPLVSVIHRRVRDTVERRVSGGRYKASGLLTDEGLRVSWIEDASVRAIDPELRGLFNINEPADLTRES
jgi:molybdopterin-guanine dinucleotide biosynthesis protein A